MTFRELTAQINALTPAEKAQIFQSLVPSITNIWPGIEKNEGVCGGEACIVRTRIPVWVLEGWRRLGWSDARILANYPELKAADLVYAWAYADAHRKEMDEVILKNEAA